MLTDEKVSAWLREHEPAVDGITALVLFACCLWFGLAFRAGTAYFVLSGLLVAPLAVRRRWPAACLAVVLVAALVQWLTIRDTTGAVPADAGVLMAVEGAAAYASRWAGWLGLGAGLAGAGLGGLAWPRLDSTMFVHLLTTAFLASTVVAGWTIGVLIRVRRKQAGTLAERARLLEVEREQRDQLAVLAERTRIAREIHDVVAHSLAGIIAQADGGRYTGSLDGATNALTAIGDHARQALAESRRVLGVLRDRPGGVPGQPGAHDIPDLVDRVRDGGLDVRLRLELPPGQVERGLSLVVYRIVQEGLTNVIKHAVAATQADVEVIWGRRELTIAVADNGWGPAAAARTGGGYGMIGIRERVSAFGGTVTLRSRPDGGHVLSACVPVPS